MKLNKQQEKAVDEITNRLINGKALTWTLMGYAGTGKSFLSHHLAEIAEEAGLWVQFIAPTNKAVQILRENGNEECSTVHKLLYRLNENTGEFEKRWADYEYLLALKALKEEKLEFRGLIICDEASMLSDKLLDDLEEFAVCKGCRLLYMGDPFQLPPVERYSRTVFDNENKSLLTQVMRQGKGSSVLAWATALRKEKLAFSPSGTLGDVFVEERISLWQEYLAKLKAGEDITMVTWKNEARMRFNWTVRKVFGFDGCTLQPGEPIMGISNGLYLHNGETVIVPKNMEFLGKDRLLQQDYGSDKTVSIPAEFYRYEEGTEEHLIILVPEYKKPSVPVGTLKGLFYWYTEGGFKKKFVKVVGEKRKKYKLADNAVICTYGYAITAHKSQGSQWNEVFITGTSKMFDDPIGNARWMYTAITRAKERVHMLRGECSRQLAWTDIERLAAEVS